MNEKYYVYVYIDPRNFEEFYYGKGKGNRKDEHLNDDNDTEKTKIIKKIKREGLKPIVKVIAKDLSSQQALLVEKTLIWKLGKNLTNKSGGHYAKNFRPQNTLHLNLNEFDYKNGIYYVNVGECKNRCWDDCRKYEFLSAGQGEQWSNQIRQLNPGDLVIAYLKERGYVGIGKVVEKAKRINSFKCKGKHLKDLDLKNDNIFENSDKFQSRI